MKKLLSVILIEKAIKKYCKEHECKKININALSKQTKIKPSSLWFYFNSERKWPVEGWLKVLSALGSAKFGPNVIEIETHNVKETVDIEVIPSTKFISNR